MERLYETLTVKLTGVGLGLLMDNGDRADPRDFIAMEKARLTATRAKNRTTQQMDLIEDLDYIGGMYCTELPEISIENNELTVEGGGDVCIITEAVESMLLEAAAKFRLGTKAQAAFLLEGPYPLLVDGKPVKVEDIYTARKSYYKRRRVRTGSGKKKSWVIAKRPLFREWSAVIDINYFPTSLDGYQVEQIIEAAGVYQGIGCYRPKYGKFDVEVLSRPNGNGNAPKPKRRKKED